VRKKQREIKKINEQKKQSKKEDKKEAKKK
jgi:hypothetical protein